MSRVLVVDDYEPVRYTHIRVLREAGFEVAEAEAGLPALELAARWQPDVVLLDVNLPDINGYEVCQRLKRQRATAHVMVVHVTASFREDRDHARGLDSGADGYLVEPVEPELLVATVRSLLRTRAAERAVQTAARQWQMTFDAITDGVALIGSDGRIARHNRRFAELCGQPGTGLVGAPVADLLPELLRAGPLAGRERRTAEFRRERWLRVTVDPVGEADDALEGMLCVVADISDARLAEQTQAALLEMEQSARLAAEAANSSKDQFLAVLSHELRTPLNAILGWTSLLAARTLDQATTERAFDAISRNTRLQIQIIEDLLDVSRIVSGKMSIEREPFELAPVLQAAVDDLQPVVRARGLALEARIDPSVGVVTGDASRVQQIVSNLLSNAIKFTAHGSVRLEAGRQADAVRISVRDTGEGIAPEFLPHVFDSFRQAESSTRRPHPGLGLGLAIVRHLVELHGGTVEAASEGLGRGATFTVRLPAGSQQAQARPMTRTPGAGDAAHLDLTGGRVLVVDDEADTREMLGTLLRQYGAAVSEATSALVALDVLRRNAVDLVISDISMPDEDGYDLVRKIRALGPPASSVLTVALTAFARDADRGRALEAGYDAHLAKPVDPRHLIATVAALLRARAER